MGRHWTGEAFDTPEKAQVEANLRNEQAIVEAVAKGKRIPTRMFRVYQVSYGPRIWFVASNQSGIGATAIAARTLGFDAIDYFDLEPDLQQFREEAEMKAHLKAIPRSRIPKAIKDLTDLDRHGGEGQ